MLDEVLYANYESVAKVFGEECEELHDHPKLYDDLFQFFAASGEMPYGTMKARTGDPFNWILNKVDEYLHMMAKTL